MAELLITVVSANDLKGQKLSPYCQITYGGKKSKTKTIKNENHPRFDQELAFKTEKVSTRESIDVKLFNSRLKGDEIIAQTSISLSFFSTKKHHDASFPLKSKDGQGGKGKISLKFAFAGEVVDEGTGTGGGGGAPKKKHIPEPRPTKKGMYQVRIHVHEARNLSGSNPNPICKITVNGQRKQTRVKQSTIRPHWNQMLLWQFNENPTKLFDETIDLQIFDAKRLRSDSIIGSFQLDIGMCWDELYHQFPRKWAMLIDPNDRGKGVVGFLKVTITVLGPGDEAPIPPMLDEDGSDDVDENLLRPGGVDLQPLDLVIKIYEAQDLPQMDGGFSNTVGKMLGKGDRDLCDPFMEISYSGKTVSTTPMQNEYNPAFGELLSLPIQIPSMCDAIRIQAFDHNMFGMHSPIAAAIMNISKISSTDADRGFLPTFGPAFINLYGAPREHTTFRSSHEKAINKGCGVSSSYRGRVLLSIDSVPGASEPAPAEPLDESDLIRIVRYKERVPFSLQVVLLEATMLGRQARKGAVRFELSMGICGNILDKTIYGEGHSSSELNSSSYFALPIFDGKAYHHLPWDNKKPLIQFESSWEDSIHRIASLNRTFALCRNLRALLHTVQDAFNGTYVDSEDNDIDEVPLLNVGDEDDGHTDGDGNDNDDVVVSNVDITVQKSEDNADNLEITDEEPLSPAGPSGTVSDNSKKSKKKKKKKKEKEKKDEIERKSKVMTGLKSVKGIGKKAAGGVKAVGGAVGDGVMAVGGAVGGGVMAVGGGVMAFGKLGTGLLGKAASKIPENRIISGAESFLQKPVDRTPPVDLDELNSDELTARILLLQTIDSLIDQCTRPLPPLPELNHTRLDRFIRNLREDAKADAVLKATELRDMLEPAPRFEIVPVDAPPVEAVVITRDILDETWDVLEGIHKNLINTAFESQNNFPDITLWLLVGCERVSYYRFPIHEVWWSDDPDERGSLFGTTQSIFMKSPKAPPKSKTKLEVPCHLQLQVRFGLQETSYLWQRDTALGGEMAMVAETYENQRYMPFKGWGTTLLPTDPSKWSDLHGDVRLPKSLANCASGWQWKGAWFVDPEIADDAEYKDAGRNLVIEDSWERSRFYPFKGWGGVLATDPPAWCDEDGTCEQTLDSIDANLQPGWHWSSEWTVDMDRNVDSDGWEYAALNGKEWHPQEKTSDLVRRRRWIRTRERESESLAQKAEGFAKKIMAATHVATSDEPADPEKGWTYGSSFGSLPRIKQKKMDTIRRRRWHRMKVLSDPSEETLSLQQINKPDDVDSAATQPKEKKIGSKFMGLLKGKEEDRTLVSEASDSHDISEIGSVMSADEEDGDSDRIHDKFTVGSIIWHTDAVCYQVRAHLYMARDLIASDTSGLSDPYCKISFSTKSQISYVRGETLTPIWDQTLIIDSIVIWGPVDELKNVLPRLVLEVFDYDSIGDHDYMGNAVVSDLKYRDLNNPEPPKLKWYSISQGEDDAGEILGAFEIIPISDAHHFPLPLKRPQEESLLNTVKMVVPVPPDIRPVTERVRVEVLAWGIRDLIDYKLLSVDKPHVEFECGGEILATEVLEKFREHQNFTKNLMYFDLDLAVVEEYMPPFNIRVYDNRKFGRKPLVGSCSFRSLAPYRMELSCEDVESAIFPMRETAFANTDTSNRSNASAPGSIVNIVGGGISMVGGGLGKVGGGIGKVGGGIGKVGGGIGKVGGGLGRGLGRGIKGMTTLFKRKEEEMLLDTIPVDFWSKYYKSFLEFSNSKSVQSYKGDPLVIYRSRLETVYDFEDTVQSFEIKRGKQDDQVISGRFKGKFRIYALPKELVDGELDQLSNGSAGVAAVKLNVPRGQSNYGTIIDDTPKSRPHTDGPSEIEREFMTDEEARRVAPVGGVSHPGINNTQNIPPHITDQHGLIPDDGDNVSHHSGSISSCGSSSLRRRLPKGSLVADDISLSSKVSFGSRRSFISKRSSVRLQVDSEDAKHADPTGKMILRQSRKSSRNKNRDATSAVREYATTLQQSGDLSKSNASLVSLTHSIGSHASEASAASSVSAMKPWPFLPDNGPCKVKVRVYIVKAIELQFLADSGKADPYIKIITNGKTIVDDRDNYIPQTLNPQFGKAFEFEAFLPRDSMLSVQIFDWALIGADELIGETNIDIEQRWLTKNRALCGLPASYVTDPEDPNTWRDYLKPTQILEHWCASHGYSPPVYTLQEIDEKRDEVCVDIDDVATSENQPEAKIKDAKKANNVIVETDAVPDGIDPIAAQEAASQLLAEPEVIPPDRIVHVTVSKILNGKPFSFEFKLDPLPCEEEEEDEPDVQSEKALSDDKTNRMSVDISKVDGKVDCDDTDIPKEERVGITLYVAKQHVALKALRACGAVLEHIETRILEVKDQPGMDQGKLEMFVDVFPAEPSIGLVRNPVDISPRKPTKYSLRVVIWNTEEVVLNSRSIFGEDMSDIYVRATILGIDHMSQKTDVHYRSLDGTGNFNWRMVFDLDWLPVEQMFEYKKKAHYFSKDAETIRVPPILLLQIWDNSIFGKGDYLGSAEINLMKIMPLPKTAKKCKLHRRVPPNKMQNLFQVKSVSGWVPCTTGPIDDDSEITGKIDIQVDLVDEDESVEKPVGKAQDEPNQHPLCPKPNRPTTSLLFFTSPFASFRHLIWKNFKWYIISFLILSAIIGFIVLFFVYFPPVFMLRIGNDGKTFV